MSRTNAVEPLSSRPVPRRLRWIKFSGALAPVLVMMLCVLLATQVVGCGEDDNGHNAAATPTFTPPAPIPSPTPTSKPLGEDIPGETLITDMAKNLVTDIGASALQDLLFPQSGVDYQTLINDFIAATQQLLTQQTIQEQAGMINGYMFNLNNDEDTWNNITDKTAQDNKAKEASIYSDVTSQASQTSASMGVLQQPMFATEGFSAWMLGAQNYLNALAFQTQMDPYLSSSDVTAADNTTLANSFSALTNYGVEEQSQIIYGSVVQAATRVTDCDKGDPCQGSDDCSYSYTDCFGHSHTYNYSLSDAAESCRSAQIPEVQTCADLAYWGCFDNTMDTSCTDGTYKSQPNQFAWIGQTFDSWNQGLSSLADKVSTMAQPCATCAHALDVIALDPTNLDMNGQPNPIGSMTYGKVVTSTASDAIAEGQVRIGSSWAAAACSGRPSCDMKLATADFDLDKPFSQVRVTYQCGDDTDHYASVAGVGNPRLNDGAYFHFDCAPGIVGAQATFRGQPVQLSGTQTDVSTHSQLGPSIPKLTDNVYAKEGTSYNDTTYAIVLPKEASDSDAAALANALVIDLGSEWTLCGGMTCSGTPTIQASGADVFQIDTSTDGVSWYDYALFPVDSAGGGLRTRPSITEPNINARYVRVWARPGQDGKYGIAELELFAVTSTGVQPISLNKPAFGPQPLITNGEYAPEGTSWDDTLYAVKLPNLGTTYAQSIDLGQVRSGINHVKVQADRNDTYQLDASVDGLVWTPLYLANRVSGSGLTTRDSGTLPPTAARYLRIYATDGDGEYSVSEVQVFSNRSLQQAVCNGKRVCYFSADELLRAELNGAAPTAQDAQDLTVTWTCADDPTPRTAQGVMWNSTPVVQLRCPASPATCNTNEPTTCSPFAAERPDDVVYENVATIPYQICVSTQYPQCVPVIQGKTNYYRTNFSTMNSPACQNVRQAIADSITEGFCPPAPGEDPYGSSSAWPYNTAIGTPPANTCLPNPIGQPALLADVGCGPLPD